MTRPVDDPNAPPVEPVGTLHMDLRYPPAGGRAALLTSGLSLLSYVVMLALILGAISPSGRVAVLRQLGPWGSLLLCVGIAALIASPAAVDALARRNLMLRLTEEGLHYRSILRFETHASWEQIVAVEWIGATLRHFGWGVTYQRELDAPLRRLTVPISLLASANAEPALREMVRRRAQLARARPTRRASARAGPGQ